MKTVAFISYKGGTGKTTLAYNMLERAASAGYRVALCDYDPQGTALAIWQLRESDRAAGLLPAERAALTVVKDSFGPEMLERLGALRSGAYDLVICDLPGADGFALNRLLSEMDLCLVPVSAGAAGFDGSRRLRLDGGPAAVAGGVCAQHCAGAGKAPCRHAGGIGLFRAAGLRGGDGQSGLASGRPAARLRGV